MSKLQYKTVNFYLDLPYEEFQPFISRCNQLFNKYISWGLDKKSCNKVQCHNETYHNLKLEFPDIPSALLQSIRDQALSNLKVYRTKQRENKDKVISPPFKKPNSAILYNIRGSALNTKNELTVRGLLKRFKIKLNFPKYAQKTRANWKFAGLTLSFNKKKNKFVANIMFSKPIPEKIDDNKILGVDRGIYNIIATSDNLLYNSKEVRKVKRKRNFLRKKLKAKGTRASRKLLRKQGKREARFSRNINHIISNLLVNSNFNIFALEDLTGIGKKRKGKILNSIIHNWSFYQLELFLIYKCLEKGKQVVYVDPRYTSQKCNRCLNINKKNRTGIKFECLNCGYKDHADLNAAKNIRDTYILTSGEKSREINLVQESKAGYSQLAEHSDLLLTK